MTSEPMTTTEPVPVWLALVDAARDTIADRNRASAFADPTPDDAVEALAAFERLAGRPVPDSTAFTAETRTAAANYDLAIRRLADAGKGDLFRIGHAANTAILAAARAGTIPGVFALDVERGTFVEMILPQRPGLFSAAWLAFKPTPETLPTLPADALITHDRMKYLPVSNYTAGMFRPHWVSLARSRELAAEWIRADEERLAAIAAQQAQYAREQDLQREMQRRNRPLTAGEVEDLIRAAQGAK